MILQRRAALLAAASLAGLGFAASPALAGSDGDVPPAIEQPPAPPPPTPLPLPEAPAPTVQTAPAFPSGGIEGEQAAKPAVKKTSHREGVTSGRLQDDRQAGGRGHDDPDRRRPGRRRRDLALARDPGRRHRPGWWLARAAPRVRRRRRWAASRHVHQLTGGSRSARRGGEGEGAQPPGGREPSSMIPRSKGRRGGIAAHVPVHVAGPGLVLLAAVGSCEQDGADPGRMREHRSEVVQPRTPAKPCSPR